MILDGLLHDVGEPGRASDRVEVGRDLGGGVAGHRCVPVLSQPVGDEVGQVPCLDAGRAARKARLVQRGDERGVQFPGGVGPPLEVVGAVHDDLRRGAAHVGRVEVGDDEHGFDGAEAEQRRNRHEGV